MAIAVPRLELLAAAPRGRGAGRSMRARAAPAPRPMPQNRSIDQLLDAWRGGSEEARDALFAAVQEELKGLARGFMRGQPAGHTLQPTALVNEACLRLCQRSGSLQDRTHLVRLAARSMRQILVDHARKRRARKRGEEPQRVPLDDVVERYEERSHGLGALDAALERLAERSPELVELVELRFFAGLPIEEVAAVLGTSPRTAARRWQVARAFLREELEA